MEDGSNQKITADKSIVSVNVHELDKCVSLYQSCCDQKGFHEEKHVEGPYKNNKLRDEPTSPVRNGASIDGGEENHLQPDETIVWIYCDVYDTGIGIPDDNKHIGRECRQVFCKRSLLPIQKTFGNQLIITSMVHRLPSVMVHI
ncbi:uncharacterized protein LOC114272293 isoform X2 [Camellia sinensis]|uniref:uncharacterized protein LOC114272293 isoform X2 n=1 Tax=Camellia sinensis TaxID=4442 RepID=UPI001036ABB6|nr:uncharacterized protein LOC114272293 isoform X2 [Camellia sinensis]